MQHIFARSSNDPKAEVPENIATVNKKMTPCIEGEDTYESCYASLVESLEAYLN